MNTLTPLGLVCLFALVATCPLAHALTITATAGGQSTTAAATVGTAQPVLPKLHYALLRLAPGHSDESKLIALKVTNSGRVLLATDKNSSGQTIGYRWYQGQLSPLIAPTDSWLSLSVGSEDYDQMTVTNMNDSGVVIGARRIALTVYPNSAYSWLGPGLYWPVDQTGAQTMLMTEAPGPQWYLHILGLNSVPAYILNDGTIYGSGGSLQEDFFDGLVWENPIATPSRLGDGSFVDVSFESLYVTAVSPQGQVIYFRENYSSDVATYDYEAAGKIFHFTSGAPSGFAPMMINDVGRFVGLLYPDRLAYWGSPTDDLKPLDSGYPRAINTANDILSTKDGEPALWLWQPEQTDTGESPTYHYVKYGLEAPPPSHSLSVGNSLTDQRLLVGQLSRIKDAQGNALPAEQQTTSPVLLVPAELAVDANRDGRITLSAAASPSLADTTSIIKPFRFWSNDDIDRLHSFEDSAADTMVDITETEEDDIGPEEAQDKLMSADCWTNNKADSKRDLEDFARLQLYIGGLGDSFKNGQLFLGLKWADVTGEPAIRVYKQHDTTGSLSYLTDEAEATAQMAEYAIRDARYQSESDSNSLHAMIHGTDTFILPTSLFANLSNTNPKTHLLFEGVKAGKGQLKIVILKQENGNYTEIGEGPGLWMDLKTIGDMYEHWSVGNDSGGEPLGVAGRVASETGSPTAFSYTATSPEEQKYILYVHGWNMEKWEKERFAETAYKRLWWQGYKGRFGLFTWPCTNRFDETATLGKVVEGLTDGTNFDRGEWTAWRSGVPLRQLLQTLSGGYSSNLYVFSHSMGGIVMSEALRLQSDAGGGQITKVYVASQAALSAHVYDGTLSTATGSTNTVQWNYDHPSIPGGAASFGPQTTNIYKNWCAYLLSGSATSSSSVGTLVNFYNQNDYALSAPVWQFNQITKPDWPDTGLQPWTYAYAGDPNVFNDVFIKTEGDLGSNQTALHLGTRTAPHDRHEIMAFAAESYVKSFGATANLTQGVTRSLDLRSIWPANGGDHKAHTWHSGQFRSTIQKQKNYWKTLLSDQAFDITTTTLP